MPTKKTAEPPSSQSSPSSPASSRSSTPEPTTSSKKRKPTTDPADEIAVDLSAPEPPSKRARRALKKGKPLPKPASKQKRDDRADLEADDDDDEANLPEQLRSSSAGKKERSSFGVWIGNLPFTATRSDVFKWLVENSGGSITEDAITRVNLPLSKDKKPGSERRDNKGFAYVDFAAYDACIAAIALSESDYGGRKLLIKDSKSFEGRPAPAPAAADETNPAKAGGAAAAAATAAPSTNTKKIYVGNLPYDATEDTLRWQFEKCGTIEWAKVATFEDSGKCKGYGWVRFADSAACDWAVKGFVKIKEAIETEDDFLSDNEGDDDVKEEDGEGGSDDGDAKKKTKKRKPAAAPEKTKTRKWWVNKLKGRPLTIQLAEDDQTRYKKRFGKDAPKTARKGAEGRGPPRGNTGSAGAGSEEKSGGSLSYHTDINVARLTGAAVAPQGKKVTFD